MIEYDGLFSDVVVVCDVYIDVMDLIDFVFVDFVDKVYVIRLFEKEWIGFDFCEDVFLVVIEVF